MPGGSPVPARIPKYSYSYLNHHVLNSTLGQIVACILVVFFGNLKLVVHASLMTISWPQPTRALLIAGDWSPTSPFVPTHARTNARTDKETRRLGFASVQNGYGGVNQSNAKPNPGKSHVRKDIGIVSPPLALHSQPSFWPLLRIPMSGSSRHWVL